MPLAGEVGFSVGRVYTSLSGWTEQRSADRVGTAQMASRGSQLNSLWRIPIVAHS